MILDLHMEGMTAACYSWLTSESVSEKFSSDTDRREEQYLRVQCFSVVTNALHKSLLCSRIPYLTNQDL